eukprot:gene11795-2150_t
MVRLEGRSRKKKPANPFSPDARQEECSDVSDLPSDAECSDASDDFDLTGRDGGAMS